jgi:hypothetical protein
MMADQMGRAIHRTDVDSWLLSFIEFADVHTSLLDYLILRDGVAVQVFGTCESRLTARA